MMIKVIMIKTMLMIAITTIVTWKATPSVINAILWPHLAQHWKLTSRRSTKMSLRHLLKKQETNQWIPPSIFPCPVAKEVRSLSLRTLQLLVIGTIATLRQTQSVTWHTTFKKRTQSLPPLSILTPPRRSSVILMTTVRKNSSWTTLLPCMSTMSTIAVSSVTTALPSFRAVKRWKQSTWKCAHHHALENQIVHVHIDSFVSYVFSTSVDQWLC